MKMAIERYKPILFVFLGCILVYVCDSSYRPPVISPFGSSANFIRAQQKREQSKDKVKLLGPVLRNQIAHFRQKGKVDLVFLVDGSGSVGQENFISEIRFVTKLLADFIVDQNSTRVAIVVYSSQKRVYRYVDYITTPGTDKHKCRLLNNDLPQIEYHGGGTYTLGAFQNAKEILRFGRKDAQQVIILITDGYSNGGDPRPEASILKKAGVRIFTFGIKNGNVQELVDMASEPKNETSYILTSFEEFEQLARRALHEDLRGGSILPQREKFCDHLCPEAHHCCHKKAECVCGTHTGHFECLCPPGYYGSGLREGCAPCPSGTYKPKSISGDISTCISCPNEENHITEPGATSAGQCVCKKGYLSTNRTDGDCSVLTCPKLDAPNNGYFVNKKCNNVYNAACGLRCEPGFELIGSSLRICKEIGIWSGTETLCIMKTCPPLPSPKHGNMICDKRDFMFATVCRFTCDTGYKLVGSRKRTCLAIALWTGITTRCREITCQPLPPLKDGFITDSVSGSSKCTGVDEVSFGTTCQISCAHGYKLLGPHTKQCTPDGLWIHSNEGGINQCIDTSAPFIRCPANIIANTNRDKATARVEWTTPVPVDNSGYIPIVTSVPAVTSPEHFPIGNTTIVYTAEDLNKNKNSCAFNITVIDNQAPTVDRCFSPFPVVSASPYINITWEPPLFSDNSDGDVKVTASHEPGLFPKGKTAVAYIAVDGAGNNSTCEIEINVLPHPCELPAAPANGLIHCAEDNDGVRCNVTCMEGYAFALDPAKTYFCAYDNVWRPKRKMPIPDCSVKILSNEVVQSTSVTFSGSLSCKEGRLLHNVETELENKISERVNVLCEDNVDCSVSSMETTCEDSDDFNKIDVVPRRARRSLLAMKPIEVESEQGGDGYSSQLTFEFTLQGSVNTSGNHLEDYKRQQLAKENLQTIIKTLKQDAKSGRFDVEMHGEKIAFTDMVLGSKDPAYQCPIGKILVGDSCVNCPIGTFYNVISRKCQNCGVGTYQHQEGRLTCSVCPEHKSTQNNRTRSLEECKDLCLPGTFSSDGLERCETCHVGYFQQLYGQKSCLPCPGRRTTLKRGSRRKSLCKFRCPVGHVSKNGLRPCYPCPKGSYQPEEGQSSCFECINGTTTTRVASTNITDCEGDGVDVMLADEAALADQIAASECFTDPCRNGGTCISDIFGYECSCLPGYTGDHCEVLINKCDARPCLNGGVCQLQVNDYSCQCVDGFMGKKCEINIDDCLDNACLNGGTCIDGVNQYRCSCQSGFEGSYCEIKLDECASKPCQNGGRCVTEVGGYTCKCLSGFMGSNCEVDIDECASNPCQNEATCMDQDNRFSCICVYGYTGLLCETDINECSDIPCQNGGTCLDLIGKYKCLCLPGFTGNKCSQELSNNFQMDFTGSTVDYARLDVVRDLPAVTIAVWVKTDDTNNYGTPFSYAVGSNENALKLHDYNGFTVYVNGEHVVTDVQVNDGRWHHIALTWTKEGGLWRLYLDGALVEKAGGMSDGRNIAGGGVFIIGQEQDTPGGGFDSRESFIGSIAHLNMWNRELSLPEIQSLRIDCSKSVGNVIAWTDVLAGLRGSLQKIPSTFCGGK